MDERIIDVVCDEGIQTNCAIKLDNVYCDGYNNDGSIGVFSHFHYDHIKLASKCIPSYDVLITHPITFEGINIMFPGMRYREQWLPQDYDTLYKFKGSSLRLLKSNHIPGSAQVHVESNNKTMLYSGDFNFPDVQIRQADFLVIDSTHGSIWADGKTDRKSIMNRLFEHVEEILKSKHQVIIQVSAGTLQEIVRHFERGYERKMKDDIEFVMEKNQDMLLHKIYRNDAQQWRKTIEFKSPDFWKILRDGKKCIIFLNSAVFINELNNVYKIFIDQYEFSSEDAPMSQCKGGYRFNLAAHASICDIIEYVEQVDPKHIVIDNSRGKRAKSLTKILNMQFRNIKTEFRPTNGQLMST